MQTPSNESWYFTALLIFFGMLALYSGGRWLGVLIPAAILVWLVASVRCHVHRSALTRR